MLKLTFKAMMAAAALMGATAMTATAQEYTIRATANSNENDEDYDGLVVFKNFVESASNGAVAVELFIGTQLCANGAECLQGVADGSIDVLHLHLWRCCWYFPIRSGSRPAVLDGERPRC